MLDCKWNCLKWPQFPIVRKCCFCVPIRRGVTIFGYVNLVLALLTLPVLIFLLVDRLSSTTPPEEDSDSAVHLSLTIAFAVIDVIMTIVMLVGAHQRRKLLLEIYLYFGIGFQVLTLCVDLVYIFDYRLYIENVVYLFFLSVNIYLLYLVYSTIRVIEESNEVQYVAYQDDRQHNAS